MRKTFWALAVMLGPFFVPMSKMSLGALAAGLESGHAIEREAGPDEGKGYPVGWGKVLSKSKSCTKLKRWGQVLQEAQRCQLQSTRPCRKQNQRDGGCRSQ